MAEPNMAEVLKRFAQRLTTSKVSERQKILGDLQPCIEKPEFPENAIKGILKHLLATLGRYHDRKSRGYVEQVIKCLAKNHGDKLVKQFNAVLNDVAQDQKNVAPSPSNAAMALSALSWSAIVMNICFGDSEKMTGDGLKKLIEIQSLLCCGAYATDRSSIKSGAYRRLKRTWKEIPGSAEKYAFTIPKLEQPVYAMCLSSCLMQFWAQTKQLDVLNKHKDDLLDVYLKNVIGARSKPALHALKSCVPLLKYVSHDKFKEAILPAVGRAMLRNPEIILEALCEMLAGLTIDLSQYAVEIGKNLATQCHSKEEETRAIAAVGCKNLAKQCSDPDSLENLVKHFFGVLNGSEGKLTVPPLRCGVVAGVGNLSYHTVSGSVSVQNLSASVAELFIPILQQEVHEGTLVHILSMFSLWCAKFTTQVPEKVIQWLKSGFGQKSSTSAVRNAYILCMESIFKGDTLIQGLDILPLLISTVEKAAGQTTQYPLVTEALSASCLLAKLSLSDIQAESKLGPFWNVILDNKKEMFVNEKFLTQASDSALQHVASLTESLAIDHPQKVSEDILDQYLKATISCLCHTNYTVRRHAQMKTKRMLAALGGYKIALALIRQFRTFLSTQKVPDVNERETEESVIKDRGVTPRILADTLSSIAYVPNAESREAREISSETVIDAHHPCIKLYNLDSWTDILAKLKLDAAKFVGENADDLLQGIKNQDELSNAEEAALSTLARLAPDVIIPKVLVSAYEAFKKPSLSTVSYYEVNVMNCPEGELFDKSVVDSGPSKEVDDLANMKRENKLYSYKDQLAELELKRELDKKKGKKPEAPKLTKKQQEAKDAQLQKESQIRKDLRTLDASLIKACSLVYSCLSGNSSALRQQLPQLVEALLPLTTSPLAAPRVTVLYVKLGQCAFINTDVDDYLALRMIYVGLRLIDPACTLEPGWTQIPLQKQATDVINKLYTTTVLCEGGKHMITAKAAFPAPTFAYIFPMLRQLLEKNGRDIALDDEAIMKILSVISAHAQLRDPPDKPENVLNENGPELLPRVPLLRLACKMVGYTTGATQQMAAKVLLDTAMSASGSPGCVCAEPAEMNILLEYLQSPAAAVREASLQALVIMEMVLPTPDVDYQLGMNLAKRIWIARHDEEEENQKHATKLWDIADLSLEPELCGMIVQDAVHNEAVIRQAVANALAAAVEQNRDQVSILIAQLLELYQDKLYMPPPVLDNFGRVISESPPDMFEARCGVAQALAKLAPFVPEEEIHPLFSFFVQTSLADRHVEVSQQMLTAAVAVVNEHGKDNVNTLLPLFEEFLTKAPDTVTYDAVRQSIVILMGSLAKHLDKEDPKVKPIVAKLIETLSTPSQQVQEAVANCLPPLVPAIKADAPDLVKKLLQLLLESENYGERKGAAYGLAGVVKGLGILALKQLEIMATLTEAIQNKKNPRYREGALFAFEMLCIMLGRLFEPYVVHLLPHLLLCFGDSSQYVRQAADETARAVMSKLSAHGVKLVLPSLLTALEEDSWRTKTGSVELLGAMAFCAPKQLSACLPSIVPKLTEVLTDSHLKVQKAGAQALKQIGSVIRNPEIQALVPVLLEALQDPTKKTTTCLQRLLDTKFVHFIDAPSLALIMPVVQRSFQDRSTETRKMAAQIIGNMYSLTDQKDLSPYLPALIPGLKQSLLDPVPEVRSVSSRALGAMVKGMGESGFVELVPWLMTTLTSENSSVDRSGAAQGLGEVVGGLGLSKLQNLMPDIITTTERSDIAPHVRDGYIMMYIYLPGVFGEDFIPYVGPIIPSILKALADESEYVRETALKAGQRIVNMYADKAIELLLPELEKGLFDDNWRIRYSSVQLLGDLLYKISGVSGKMSTEGANEDDNFGTEMSQKAILSALGMERRNRVLAGLYMGRSDTSLMVRQAALHVWKVVVTHTPKMLRDILPILFQLLLGCLASKSYDKRQVAARTLGDIVRKLGEKVLPEIIPILERELESDDADKRQGVCIGLSEIMSSTSKDHVIVFADSLIPTVRRALCDPLPEVRQAAARTFDNLHSNIGPRALDDILPFLLQQLDNDDMSEYALDGLKQVMAVKSRVVLPYLVPQLTATPVNTRALSFMASVAGEALTRHLGKILPALMKALGSKIGTPEEEQELEYCQSVVLSVADDIGVRVVMDELLSASNMSNDSQRCAAVTILHAYCENTKADYLEYVPQLFRGLLHLFTDSHPGVLLAAWNCLNAVTKKLDASEMLTHISNLRQALRFAVSDFKGEELPGFCIPKKGITPILPIFREGILNGSQDLKESAAIGLGEVIKRTSAAALKPSVVNITGPLIRILGDRFTFAVKVAVLETLGLLLGKCGVMLKPFLPQLQTTFVKALNDPNRAVRLKAASALGQLIVIHTRVDPLFNELQTSIKTAEDNATRDTTLQALRGCISGAGAKMGDKVRKEIVSLLDGLLTTPEDSTRTTAAACLGVMCGTLNDSELSSVMTSQLLDSDASADWTIRHARSVALGIALKHSPEKICGFDAAKVERVVLMHTTGDRIPVCLSGLRAVGYLLQYQVSSSGQLSAALVAALSKCMKHESNDIKQTTAKVVSCLARSRDAPLEASVISGFVPMLVMGTKEKNTIVRSNCETALINILRMRYGDDILQSTLSTLESGMKDSLNEVASKSLKKLVQQADTPEDLDDTVLV